MIRDLDTMVRAVNMARAAMNENAPRIREAIEPWIGRKIIKVDGSMRRAFRQAMPPLPNHRGPDSVFMYIPGSHRCLRFDVNVCVRSGDGCEYYRTSFGIAIIQDAALMPLPEFTPLPLYDLAEVRARLNAVKAAEKALQEARKAAEQFAECY